MTYEYDCDRRIAGLGLCYMCYVLLRVDVRANVIYLLITYFKVQGSKARVKVNANLLVNVEEVFLKGKGKGRVTFY